MMWWCSSAGDLYEYDRKSKPSWKKHIWHEKTVKVSPLVPSKGCIVHGLSGDHSESLFLLTKVFLMKVFYEHIYQIWVLIFFSLVKGSNQKANNEGDSQVDSPMKYFQSRKWLREKLYFFYQNYIYEVKQWFQ